MRWNAAAVGAAALLLAASGPALAETATRADGKGRTITFDLQAPGVDVDGYARLLSESLHGDEISTVVVRVVPGPAIATECGAGAAACFQRIGDDSRIIVPATTATGVRDSLIHEYGHHVDSTVRHQAGRCPDGTPRWWAARGAAALLSSGELRCDYGAGWSRSVAEVFAEDYRVLNVPGATSRGAAGQPTPAVLDALRLDLAELDRAIPPAPPGAMPEPVPPPDPAGAPNGAPVAAVDAPVLRPGRGLARAGRVKAGRTSVIRFRVTAKRRVALVVRRRGALRADFSVVLRCGRGPVLVGDGRRRSVVTVAGRVGPGRCTATIRAGRKGLSYSARVLLPR